MYGMDFISYMLEVLKETYFHVQRLCDIAKNSLESKGSSYLLYLLTLVPEGCVGSSVLSSVLIIPRLICDWDEIVDLNIQTFCYDNKMIWQLLSVIPCVCLRKTSDRFDYYRSISKGKSFPSIKKNRKDPPLYSLHMSKSIQTQIQKAQQKISYGVLLYQINLMQQLLWIIKLRDGICDHPQSDYAYMHNAILTNSCDKRFNSWTGIHFMKKVNEISLKVRFDSAIKQIFI
ncbi:hypothetical protein Bhyg_11933 [Pseudolycoriella hygida]|uniref:Uncharacterized protein n=1 Tax=Pseudolycoriella hygida TaxID=35572 RepID=A0A9Q0S0Q3_9DIPT|nr:hypothetical protein Bhyg_11933 [Pseudolycoriella hygida]